MKDLKEKICPSKRADCRYGYGDNVCDNCNKILDEYIAEHDKQVRADAFDECIQIVQKIKDDYNDAKFGEQIPINYGTICGIIINLTHLKEQNNDN